MRFDRRLANIRAPVVRGLCCHSSQNHEKGFAWNHGK